MSEIQIRQMPLSSSINSQRLTGSWFPTSYYGHFRAKSRADLCSYFRQLAQPKPPRTFLHRHNSEATTHMFSKHDNRFKFECDPLVRGTQAGFGKRKAETNTRGEFDPFFVGWLPKNADRKNYIDDIKTTSYANDYNGDCTSSQILSDVQSMSSLSLPSTEVSVYSSIYNHGQPDNQQAKQIRQETFQRFSTTQTRRAQLQRNDRSTNVASCLAWNSPSSDDKPIKTNYKKMSMTVPTTLQSRINEHVMSTINQPKPSQSQLKQVLRTIEQPRIGMTTSREHYTAKIIPPPRAATSFEQTHTNSLDCLISKYM